MAAYTVLQDALKISRQFRLLSTAKIVSFARQISRKEVAVEVEVGGRPLKISSGKLAFLADGATVVEHGETSVLVTATSAKTSETGSLNLLVDYREKASAACLIPGNFFRRELGPYEAEMIVSRYIDRSLRSLFVKGYFYDTQIIASLLVTDGIDNPGIAALNGASAALAISSIPWNGPIGAVRIGDVDGQFIVNPSSNQMKQSQLDLVVASSENKIVMLEGSAMEISNEKFFEAVRLGFQEAQPIINAIKELQSSVGKEKREYTPMVPSEEISNAVHNFASDKLREIFSNFTYKKLERDDEIYTLRDNCIKTLQEDHPDIDKTLLAQAFYNTSKDVLKKNIFDTKQRCDGRSVHQLRDIKCEVNIFNGLHGSALFDRGETQVFSTATFGPASSAAKMDAMSKALGGDAEKQFMLHYEFPPFATNEFKHNLKLGRREVGHGMLSEKALLPILPKEMNYAMRITSQVLASNGSSSMASACAGSLAMMDAGVQTQKHVAGTACGLITSKDANDPDKTDIDEYQILTDILGIEDYLGDMDFKIAGTRDGITALQADFKIPGLPLHVIEEILQQSSEDRNKVLDIMEKVINGARDKDKNCPITGVFAVPASKRKQLIGPGGSVIKGLEKDFGISLTQLDNEEYAIYAPDQYSYDLAMTEIKQLIKDKLSGLEILTSKLEKGSIYEGKITRLMQFGVIVKVFDDCPDLLLHSKELDHNRAPPEEIGFSVGDTVKFKYLGLDKKNRIVASRKVLLPPSPIRSRSPVNKPYNAKKVRPSYGWDD